MIDEPRVIACQGPPRCDLAGEEAEAAMRAGCPWCERYFQLPDGRWEVLKPSEA